MRKLLITGVVLAAAVGAARRLGRQRGESSAPESIPFLRAIWPVTEDVRQLASRCRWRDLVEDRRSADSNQHLRQRMPGERADAVASRRMLGEVRERTAG